MQVVFSQILGVESVNRKDGKVPQRPTSSGASAFKSLQGRLIVSCQAAQGDPLDHIDTLTRIAASVIRGGAGGLRAEGVERVAAFRAMTDLPIIGIIKTYDANGDVYITPDFKSAQAVSDAGAVLLLSTAPAGDSSKQSHGRN